MSASVATVSPARTGPSLPPAGRTRRRVDGRLLVPTLFAAVNAVAFLIVRPDVNDLWAARARASAMADGVGLTYWFSWFGGGSTPGNYSVLTPTLSALVGSELLVALAALAVTVVGTVALRGTRRQSAGAWVLAYVASVNLWSGRVPFLVGGVAALGAIITLRHGKRAATVALTLLSILLSPVCGAFLALGLSGTYLTTATRQWRPIIAWCVGSAAAALLGVAVVFGTPGPEPFSTGLALQVVISLGLLWVARPPGHLRTTIQWSVVVVIALYLVPNGMGSNYARFVWFCLPVVVVATTRRPRLTAVLLIPILLWGTSGTLTDLRNAARPISSVGYYLPLADQLDRAADLANYRVEVVNHGAHAGYDALLGRVMLARGWETQEDVELNTALTEDPLDPVTYKVWLDNNAVGYVALPSTTVRSYPEYDLVASGDAPYLREIWHTPQWRLFQVEHPIPIVSPPATIVGHTQSTLTVDVSCRCTVNVRIRYSKFLDAARRVPAGSTPRPGRGAAKAVVADDGSHWTTITTTVPGRYVLSGSLSGFLR